MKETLVLTMEQYFYLKDTLKSEQKRLENDLEHIKEIQRFWRERDQEQQIYLLDISYERDLERLELNKQIYKQLIELYSPNK